MLGAELEAPDSRQASPNYLVRWWSSRITKPDEVPIEAVDPQRAHLYLVRLAQALSTAAWERARVDGRLTAVPIQATAGRQIAADIAAGPPRHLPQAELWHDIAARMAAVADVAARGAPATDYQMGAMVPVQVSFGADGTANPTWPAELATWWQGMAAFAHRAVVGMSVAAGTGVVMPREAYDPESARRYLVQLAVDLAQTYRWPPIHVERLKVIPAGPTVADTVTRMRSAGPPRGQQGAEVWYTVAYQLEAVAVQVSMGEALGRLRNVDASSLREARDWVANGLQASAVEMREATKQIAFEASRGLATGAGMGLGTAIAILALTGFGLYAFGPALVKGGTKLALVL